MASLGSKLLRPLILCGPSGAGKSTLVKKFLLRDFGAKFGFSVSHTTRKPREGEVDGVDYHFVASKAHLQELIDSKPCSSGSSAAPSKQPFFVETAQVHGNLYGTSFDAVRRVQEQGRICLLDIDIQGVRTIHNSRALEANSCFMTPPLALLEERLRGRGSETEDSLRTRLANAERELAEAQEAGEELFQAMIVADSTAEIYEQLVPKLHEWYPQLTNS
eukprot:INCI8768.1.p1 GENE.INCI8768.1~~INCI8768.1.p1  ORF type:complete len:219 (+),score=34.06 INCI8768.1:256-912(+)